MFLHLKSLFAVALLVLAGAAHADNCEPIRAKIEAQIRDAGVARFSVTVVPNDTPVTGEVVGSCDNGQQKIIYTRGVTAAEAPAAAQPARPASPSPVQPVHRPTPETEILTECKDGSVSRGGTCPPVGR